MDRIILETLDRETLITVIEKLSKEIAGYKYVSNKEIDVSSSMKGGRGVSFKTESSFEDESLFPLKAGKDLVSDNASKNIKGRRKRYTDEFDLWWNLYPKKTGKRVAFTAFERALKEISFNDLMSDTSKWIENCKPSERKFIPNPSTWLNQERWEDEAVGEAEEIENSLFAVFYDQFPRHGNRDEAKFAFQDIVDDGYPAEKIVAAVHKFKNSNKGLSEYCPSPASWLKQGWYKDDPSMWNKGKPQKADLKEFKL